MDATSPRQRATLVNSRSRETRQALIRAAVRLWGTEDFDRDFEASTVADIAAAAGVSKGSFYFHFANKEAILAEMSSTTVQAMLGQVEAGAADRVPLDILSEQVMAAVARRVVRAPKGAALRAGTFGFTGQASLARARLGDAFEALVRYGRQHGDLAARLDIDECAAMLTAVTAEAIIRWGRGDRSDEWLERTLRDRVAVVLRGLG